MQVVRGLPNRVDSGRGSVVTIGMFDGVHVGHQRLIYRAVGLARRKRARSVVVTFDPDPRQALDPANAPPQLTSLPRRIQLIGELGPEAICVIPFTAQFAQTTPEDFVKDVLADRLDARDIVVGENFAFGRNRTGNLLLLRRVAKGIGIRVVVVAPVVRDGQPVSSSRVRRLVQAGAVKEAARLLGRPAELWGVVVRGDRRGRRLGFPTANIRLSGSLRPVRGVYKVWLESGRRRLTGLMNLGVRPTFAHELSSTATAATCEVHLVGFRGRLYGRHVMIGLLARLRDERRFDSADELTRQIGKDLVRAGLS
ncbi:MAG: bifunctional riboflavin kinase/FAD synthetase [Candidatus Omnitrophica bacterium]|nr:bifunctional riboflavin kinase/FAD synthetase [Candidatus Omnitrophota bacterium]